MTSDTEHPTTSPSSTLPLLDSAVLRSFVTIAETGSFSRAARLLFRTPAALSMQIKRLEETLERPLFVREARQVRLTPEGEVLLGYGRRLLLLNEEAVTQFLAPKLEGRVRLGTPDDVGTRMLPTLLSQFARMHPRVQVDVIGGRSADMRFRIDRGDLDLALVTLAADEAERERPDMRVDIVYTEALVWVGCEGGIAAERRPVPIALANPGCPWRATALSALHRSGVRYRVAYTSENTAGQQAAASADLAVAPLPVSSVSAPLHALGPETGLPELDRYHVALVRKSALGPVTQAFADAIEGAFADLQAGR
ncbi:LysR family transcriptional regulator [Algiphilus sp.]|uniref:LysR family transcriptional regulator n=1 Tax=Algiphilus sp. TaxID=1872431 RepID=UPI003B51C457